MRVALPESGDIRTLNAVASLLSTHTAKEIWLWENPKTAAKITEQHKCDPTFLTDSRIKWVFDESPQIDNLTAQTLASNLQQRGKPVEQNALQAQSKLPLFQAGTLLAKGTVDTVIAGAVATTTDVIRAALATVGLAPKIKTVSGSFLVNRSASTTSAPDNHLFLFADCGVVVSPTIEQLIDIASESVKTWIGIANDPAGPVRPPVVAFLSFSTKGSAQHEAQEKMAAAARAFKEKFPEVCSDGELQFDAAFDAEIGSRKAPGSLVPGRANIFIFPDLNSGNIAYKITQRLGGFTAYGPILQGLRCAYSDLSRGATAEDIVTSVHINSLRAYLAR